jgi:hypothetical protein
MVDERKTTSIATRQRTSPKDGLKTRGSDSANTNTLLEYRARIMENGATPGIPAEYEEFLHLF